MADCSMQSLITIRETCPQYAHDNLWCFKYGAGKQAQFDNALEHIHDLLLTAEVTHFREASHLFFVYQEEVRKVQERMWEAGQLRDASAHRLEGANVLDRIEAAAEELDCRMTLRQVHMERGSST